MAGRLRIPVTRARRDCEKLIKAGNPDLFVELDMENISTSSHSLPELLHFSALLKHLALFYTTP